MRRLLRLEQWLWQQGHTTLDQVAARYGWSDEEARDALAALAPFGVLVGEDGWVDVLCD